MLAIAEVWNKLALEINSRTETTRAMIKKRTMIERSRNNDCSLEISQHLSSDYLQPKFPSIPHLQREKIQMLQVGRRFDRVLVGSAKTFLSLQD
jgi:hypothetical protein